MSNQSWRFNSNLQRQDKEESSFLFVAFNSRGAIDAVSLIRSATDGQKAAEARAMIQELSYITFTTFWRPATVWNLRGCRRHSMPCNEITAYEWSCDVCGNTELTKAKTLPKLWTGNVISVPYFNETKWLQLCPTCSQNPIAAAKSWKQKHQS
jgi:hypothetical protein